MIEVTIRNFQSIAEASFKIEGFTAFVGKSNIGKSAVVRAIKSALTAASGTDFVRHGEACERRIKGNKKCRCFSEVRLKFDFLELLWEKGDSKNQYTITKNGETNVYTAIDRGTPDFLKPEFAPLKVGSDAPDVIQVSPQFDPIFLLNKSGPAVADVISDVARLDNINQAMRLVMKDRKDAVTKRKIREQDQTALEEVLKGYQGLDPVLLRVRRVEERHAALQKAQERFQWLTERCAALDTLEASVGALEAATAPLMPEEGSLDQKRAALISVSGFIAEISARAPDIRRLTGIDKVALPDEAAIENGGERLGRIGGWVNSVLQIQAFLKRTTPVEEASLPAESEVLSKLTALDNVQRLLRRAEPLAREVQALMKAEGVVVPEDPSLESKAASLSLLDRGARKQERLEETLKTLATDTKAAEQEEAVVLSEFEALGACPYCTQPIDANHMAHAVGA